MKKKKAKSLEAPKTPVSPIRSYYVLFGEKGVAIQANDVQEEGEALVCKNIWKTKDGEEEEIKGIFRNWDSIIDIETAVYSSDIKGGGEKLEYLVKEKTP